jgi:hypothetical protein
MLRPNWVKPRIGPIFRGGIDLNSYHRQILLMGLFEKPSISLPYTHDILMRLCSNQVDEAASPLSAPQNINSSSNVIINFCGDNGRFKYLNGYDDIIKSELISITKLKWRNFANTFADVPIGINVRMGNDFRSPQSPEDHFIIEATKTPIKWFVESLIAIREFLGFNATAYVVSDGSASDLSHLLSLPNTFFVRPGCAISDLLILSKSKILIRSGGSTFTAWASFLGQMPTISHPGYTLDQSNMINKFGYYIGDFLPESPNTKFLNDIKNLDL